jgi:hypothetical protein
MGRNCGSFGESKSGSIELERRRKIMWEENAEAKLQKIRLFLEKLEQGIHECRELLKSERKQA